MAEATGRLAIAAAAAAALAVGAAAGWLAARALEEPPPPPPSFANPMAKTKVGDVLALRRADGTIFSWSVKEADLQSLLLVAETQPSGAPLTSYQMRVARGWYGSFQILEGDLPPGVADASSRDFILDSVTPETWTPPTWGKPLRCWKFKGRHRVHGETTTWVSDEIPIHGVVRIDGPRGTLFEYHASNRAP